MKRECLHLARPELAARVDSQTALGSLPTAEHYRLTHPTIADPTLEAIEPELLDVDWAI